MSAPVNIAAFWLSNMAILLSLMFSKRYSNIVFHFLITVIECPSLSLTNGIITYFAVDTIPDIVIGTVATHTCDAGFTLVGDVTRNCEEDNQADTVGVWSGSPPSCDCKNK